MSRDRAASTRERSKSRTREALLKEGALLFARHGVDGVTTRQLHDAVGARNESALHYYFGDKAGLVTEIVWRHVQATEARRAILVAEMAAKGKTPDLTALVTALVAPMAEDLATPIGRAHLRIVAQLSHPSLAYKRAFDRSTPSGATVAAWLRQSLTHLPTPVRTERLAALRAQLIGLLGLRAQLLDDRPAFRRPEATRLFVCNLIDMVVAGLVARPSRATIEASADRLA